MDAMENLETITALAAAGLSRLDIPQLSQLSQALNHSAQEEECLQGPKQP